MAKLRVIVGDQREKIMGNERELSQTKNQLASVQQQSEDLKAQLVQVTGPNKMLVDVVKSIEGQQDIFAA